MLLPSIFQIYWWKHFATQGEEELENFLEQHRRAMSASRERESQIRYVEKEKLSSALKKSQSFHHHVCGSVFKLILIHPFRESIAREIGQCEGKDADSHNWFLISTRFADNLWSLNTRPGLWFPCWEIDITIDICVFVLLFWLPFESFYSPIVVSEFIKIQIQRP